MRTLGIAAAAAVIGALVTASAESEIIARCASSGAGSTGAEIAFPHSLRIVHADVSGTIETRIETAAGEPMTEIACAGEGMLANLSPGVYTVIGNRGGDVARTEVLVGSGRITETSLTF